MSLIRAYSDSAISQIYSNVVQLSLYNYESLSDSLKEIYSEKYENALLVRRQLDEPALESKEDIIEFLCTAKEESQRVAELNQETINLYSTAIEEYFLRMVPIGLDVFGKLEFLFDFITGLIDYSEDAYQYCVNVPPIDGFFFDFYQGVPISNTYPGLLVTRQGLCEDISNLCVYLARLLHIPVELVTCLHQKNQHAINQFFLDDGSVSYIDLTSFIRGNKSKEESFLVSKELLNRGDDYALDDTPSVTLPKLKHPPYDMEAILSNILTPSISFQNAISNPQK